MNAQTIAKTLLERQQRINPMILPGQLLKDIGAEGVQEALNRRWLVPDTFTGCLLVSTDAAKVQEMRQAAATESADLVPPSNKIKVTETHDLAYRHAMRPAQPINELMAPGTGSDKSAPVTFQQPKTNSPTSAPDSANPGVGDEVTVVENGKAYTGTVSAAQKNGLYSVSFGAEKPSMTRDYKPNEIKINKKSDQAH